MRNEAQDLQRALALGDLRWARLVAIELEVCLSTTRVPQEQTTNPDAEAGKDTDGQRASDVFSILEQDLARAYALLKDNEPARVAEVVARLLSISTSWTTPPPDEAQHRGGAQRPDHALHTQATRPQLRHW